jgi:hypothetical protein
VEEISELDAQTISNRHLDEADVIGSICTCEHCGKLWRDTDARSSGHGVGLSEAEVVQVATAGLD